MNLDGEQSMRSMVAVHESLQKKHVELKGRAVSLEKELDLLRQQNEEIQQEHNDELETVNRQHAEFMAKLKEELVSLKSTQTLSKTAENAYNTLQAEHGALQQELDELRQRQHPLKEGTVTLMAMASDLKQKNDALRVQLDHLQLTVLCQKPMDDVDQTTKNQRAMIEELRRDLRSKEHLIETLRMDSLQRKKDDSEDGDRSLKQND